MESIDLVCFWLALSLNPNHSPVKTLLPCKQEQKWVKGMGTLVSPLILTSSSILGLGLTAGSADVPRAVGICELRLGLTLLQLCSPALSPHCQNMGSR